MHKFAIIIYICKLFTYFSGFQPLNRSYKMKKIFISILAIITSILIYCPSSLAENETFTITLISEPTAGGVVTGGGEYSGSQNVHITASPAPGYTFIGWFKPDENEPFSTELQFEYDQEQSRTYIARFELEIPVETAAEPAIGGTVKQNGSGTYPQGTDVELTASANEGYEFIGWFDSSSPIEPVHTEPVFNFTVENPVSYIARFAARYTLNIEVNPRDAGTANGSGMYTGGSIVLAEAFPNKDYRFVGWTNASNPDNIISTEIKYAFNLDDNLTLTAKFDRSFSYITIRVLIGAGIAAVCAFAVFLIIKRSRIIRRRRTRNGIPPKNPGKNRQR